MPAKAFVVRFRNGDYEYDLTRRPIPPIGETMRRQGVDWAVTRITQNDVTNDVTTVHVERVDAEQTK